jgi:high-affinity nickel-transport protein
MKGFACSAFRQDNGAGNAIGVYVLLIATNVTCWLWALVVFGNSPMLLGTALLAYSLGLRHAFDADHIAAIDNVIRKLMEEGKRPLGAGLFFSLGHSTIVVGVSVAIALSNSAFEHQIGVLKRIGGPVGSLSSTLFLLLIAAANILVFTRLCRLLRTARQGGDLLENDVEGVLANRGFQARMFRILRRVIQHSWQMYPLGFVFGLSFDTATEIGLLGISSTQAAQGMSLWSIMVFPALFTAAMTLMDTTACIFMLRAYNWAFVRPTGRLYYNLTTTAFSVVAAVVAAVLQTFDLLADQFDMRDGGSFWGVTGYLSDNAWALSIFVVCSFIAAWLISYINYRVKCCDDLANAAAVSETKSAGGQIRLRP